MQAFLLIGMHILPCITQHSQTPMEGVVDVAIASSAPLDLPQLAMKVEEKPLDGVGIFNAVVQRVLLWEEQSREGPGMPDAIFFSSIR